MQISPATRLACLVGTPVSHSISPAVHNFIYRALDVDMVYLAFRVDDVGAGVAAIRTLGIRGAGVSIPHKEAVVPHLDELAPLASAIGALNTIVNDDGVLRGHNTDVTGAMAALKEGTELAGRRVALIGAGGSARAIGYGLKHEGAVVSVFNRTVAKAEALAAEVGLEASGSLSDHEAIAACDVVVNASSVGMGEPDASPLPASVLGPQMVVFDIVYSPLETRLLRDARSAGATVVYGDRMLIHGVREQAEMFSGRDVPPDLAEEALRHAQGR